MQVIAHSKRFEVAPAEHAQFWQNVSDGAWEASTFTIFDRFLSRQHSYIDIGAWIGPTLLYGCQTAKSAYGLEPDPLAYAELERNVALNRPQSDNVRLFNACIAPRSGQAMLGSRAGGNDSTSSLLFGKKKTHWSVKAFSFKDFVSSNQIADCNFIKMDIEGGEYRILPTMTEYLKKHRPTMHLSLHPCYLKLRPFGWPGRILARLAGTLKILRCTGFYRHRYDHSGRELGPMRLLWLCCAKISMDVVLTDLDWSAAASRSSS
jgi:FkbM family methyltransferase